MKNTQKTFGTKQIAQQRIDIIFKQADLIGKTDPTLATEYIKIAQKIAMAARIPIPQKYKQRVCKHCKTLLITGYNNRVRIQQKREPHIVVTCLNCGYHLRILIKNKKKERTKNEQNPNIPHETTR